MKNAAAMALLACACMGPVTISPARAATKADGIEKALKQSENDLGNALRDQDMANLNLMFADDFRTVGGSGKSATKETILASVKAGKAKLESFEIGPMDVKVLGPSVATVQGNVSETRNVAGVKTDMKVTWMDVWQKRGNRWVLVRSQTSILK